MVDDAKAQWSWQPFPLEESSIVPSYTDLIVEETSATWAWVDIPFEVTDT
jgi:hypothetical protein